MGGVGAFPYLCKDAAGTGGAGWGAWDAATFGVTVYLCPGLGRGTSPNQIVANLEFVVAFNVTNPAESQESPDVSVWVRPYAPHPELQTQPQTRNSQPYTNILNPETGRK